MRIEVGRRQGLQSRVAEVVGRRSSFDRVSNERVQAARHEVVVRSVNLLHSGLLLAEVHTTVNSDLLVVLCVLELNIGDPSPVQIFTKLFVAGVNLTLLRGLFGDKISIFVPILDLLLVGVAVEFADSEHKVVLKADLLDREGV